MTEDPLTSAGDARPSAEPGTHIFTVPQDGVARLDTWLVTQMDGFSRARIQGLIDTGRVNANGVQVTKAGWRPTPGQTVTVTIPPPVPAIPAPENIPLNILFEDDDILVLDKPAGLVVHPAPGHLTGTLVNALLHHCPELSGIGGVARPGIVHRLDQDTSGVMVVAKSQRAMDALTREFATHANLTKTYLAICHGIPAPAAGRLESFIGRSPVDRKKMALVTKNGKKAVTNYRVTGTLPLAGHPKGALSRVTCTIETGRTHQIRVHLASCGCPIAGDALYGHPAWDKLLPKSPGRQLLHALRLTFRHPVSRQDLTFEAPLPDDMTAFPFQ